MNATSILERRVLSDVTLKVLVIEDDSASSRIIQEMLRSEQAVCKFKVTVSNRISESLKQLNTNSFDVILLDLNLPDANGINSLVEIRRTNPDIPIVVLTVENNSQQGSECLENGAHDYLTKGEITCLVLQRSLLFATQRQQLLVSLEQSRQELKSREMFLSSITNGITDSLVVVNAQKKILYLNPQASKFMKFEWKVEQFLGLDFSVDSILEITVDNSDRKSTLEVRASEILWESETAYVILIRDISAKKQAEEKITKINERLRYAIKELELTQEWVIQEERLSAIGELAAGVAHNLNNILCPIRGYCSLLKQGYDLPEDVLTILGTMETSTFQATQVVQQLLEFSNKECISTLTQIDLEQLVISVVELGRVKYMHQRDHQSPVSVFLQLDQASPIMGYPHQLKKSFFNLLSNAIESIEASGTVLIRLGESEHGPVVIIEDQGCGMSQKTLNQIWEPFYTTKVQHIGLGGSVASRIIKRHGGKISLESTLGKGTKVKIQFPNLGKSLNSSTKD